MKLITTNGALRIFALLKLIEQRVISKIIHTRLVRRFLNMC